MGPQILLIDESVKKIEYLFRFTGINIKLEEKSRMDKYRCTLIFIFNFLWLNTDVLAPIYWFIDGFIKHKKFTELTYVASCFIYSIFSEIKVLGVLTNERTIYLLIDRIREMEIAMKNRERHPETECIINTEHLTLQRLLKVLSTFYMTLIVIFSLSPLALVLLNYYKTNELVFLLPVSATYPCDTSDMRYYPWIYLHQCVAVLIVISYITTADFLFYILCTYLSMQLRLLQFNIVNLIPLESKNEILQEREGIKCKLMTLVIWHQNILSSVDLLEIIYTRSTLFNFVASSILLCLTGFNLVEIDSFVLTFLCFLLMSLLQIFVLCLYGDILKDSSSAVGDAVYNSNWYLADPQLAKIMLLVQTRSQTPCNLTAWGYAEVNLRAFMKICSTAWSYFALLQTVYSGPNTKE